jgi:hypothetical protein
MDNFFKSALLLLLLFAESATATSTYWVDGALGTFHSSPQSACQSFMDSKNPQPGLPTKINLQQVNPSFFSCNIELWNSGMRLVDSTNITISTCPQGTIFQSGACVSEIPTCPSGSSYDFDSESCKYPQDDACGSIGASWNPTQSACQCNDPLKLLVTAGGVSRCIEGRDDSCTKDSPDFKGFASFGPGAGRPICDGRASCPNGGTPGYIGSGDSLTAICYNNDTPDPDCDGTKGLLNGKTVCIPKPGKDPDFPDCSGVVGTFNGVKQCISKPTDHPDCKPGETAGYVGKGSEMNFTCIPSDYKPDTCPPGQYITNTATGGFGCATANGQSKDDKDAGKTPGKVTANSTTEKKDADGKKIGTKETESGFDFGPLLTNTPNSDYKKEMDDFGKSALDGLKTDELLDSFSGESGAFTERSSLNELSSFVKTHTIGNSASCGGSLPFFGMVITCEKFATYNRIIGWMIFIYTMISIYNTIMRKSESGV